MQSPDGWRRQRPHVDILDLRHGLAAQAIDEHRAEPYAHLALGLCHWAYVLETGQMAMTGTGKALLASEEIRKAYLGE